MSNPATRRVELASIELSADGASLVLELVTANQQSHRMELPSWTVYQLMRILPRIDAALVQSRSEPTTDLVAHSVLQWSVQHTGADDAVAMSMQNDQRVESAFLFETDEARALHAALGKAIEANLARWPQRASSPINRARSVLQARAAVDSTCR